MEEGVWKRHMVRGDRENRLARTESSHQNVLELNVEKVRIQSDPLIDVLQAFFIANGVRREVAVLTTHEVARSSLGPGGAVLPVRRAVATHHDYDRPLWGVGLIRLYVKRELAAPQTTVR
jgi:hypothetical protein